MNLYWTLFNLVGSLALLWQAHRNLRIAKRNCASAQENSKNAEVNRKNAEANAVMALAIDMQRKQ